MRNWPSCGSSSPVHAPIEWRCPGVTIRLVAVWAVLRLGMPGVMHGCVLSLSLAAWIRNEEDYLNELRTNPCSFDLTPKPNVTLLWFSQMVTRISDRCQARIALSVSV
jgi:hypothetical protein